MHVCSNCQKSSSDGDLTISLGITIVTKRTQVSNLSLLQCSSITLCLSQTETRSFLFAAIFCTVAGSYLVPCSGCELFVMLGTGTCWSSHSLQTPSDSAPTVTWFPSPWGNAYLPNVLFTSSPWTGVPIQPPEPPHADSSHSPPWPLTAATQCGSTWHGGSLMRKETGKPGIDILPCAPCVALPTSSHSSTSCRPLIELLFPWLPFPSPLFSRLYGPNSHAHSSQVMFSRPLTIFVGFRWTLSNWATSFWKFSALSWAEHPCQGLTQAEKENHSICLAGCNLVHVSWHRDDLMPLTNALPLICYDPQTILCSMMLMQAFFLMQLLISV